MSFLDTIFGKIGFARKAHIESLPLATGAGEADPFAIWLSSKKIQPQKVMDLYYSGWSYACIRAIAEELANMEIRLFRLNQDGTKEELLQHDLLDLLESVNSHQTGYELKYLTGAHLEMVGNAYWLLDGVENERDKPTAIYPLNPKYVRVLRDTLPNFVKGYQYRVGAHLQTFSPYQIVHLKYPDPNDSYEGIGTMQAIFQWIETDNFAMEFNRRFFLNGGRIGGFLESENAIMPEQLEYLKKSFEAIFRGVENAYKVAALPKGTTFKEGAQTQKDMDFVNLQSMMRDKILAGFRVPRTALGITDDVNRANAETTNYVFALRTIKPKMQLIVSYLNEFLAPRFGDDLFFTFKDPVPENREQKIQEMQTATGNQPVISTNEAREEYFGLGGIENGDAVMTDFSKVPLGEPKPQKTARKPKTKVNGKPSTRFARNAKKRKEISGSIAKKAIDELKNLEKSRKEVRKKITKKDISSLTDEEYEILWKGFVTRVTPFEKAQAKAIREFNSSWEKEALENLPEAVKSKAIDPDDLFDLERSVGVLVDLSLPILTDLFAKEGKEAMGLLGLGDIDILTPEARNAIEEAIALMSESYNKTTRAFLKEKLEAGQQAGASLEELKDEIRAIKDFSDEVRAEQVARTETFRIANNATREAWEQSGVVKTIKWYTAADERVCPFCEPLHGKVIDIEETFFDEGDQVRGSDGSILDLEYDDVRNPPLHVSCRCYTRAEEISIE